MDRLSRLARNLRLAWVALAAVVSWLATPAAADDEEPQAQAEVTLERLSLAELMNIEVTTISRRPESLHEAAAAMTVIRGETIERSGVTSIADALRLAPGVHVAQIDANKWSVGIRGFGSRLSRSVLAIADGRTLYTPLFAGVYWETQDTLLDDLDRIEVIRGPGGSLWGSNAYSGVINIISKSSRDTQGWHVSGGGGSQERGFGAFRYGGKIGDGIHYRVYGKYFDRGPGAHEGEPYDAWDMGQTGFRADWERGAQSVSLFGNLYQGRSGQKVPVVDYEPPFSTVLVGDSEFSGQNVLATWRRAAPSGRTLELTAWYDRSERNDPHFKEDRNTFDVEMKQRVSPFRNHDVNWGVGYRGTTDRTSGVPTVEFMPAGRTLALYNAFVQDTVRVGDHLRVALGVRAEHNDFTGLEFQPSVRASWSTPAQTLWGAVSRAVRTPSRLEHDLALTAGRDPVSGAFFRVMGDPSFVTEKLIAFELGFRQRFGTGLAFDTAVFRNLYDDTLSLEPGDPFLEDDGGQGRLVFPFVIQNRLEGDAFGVEIAPEATLTDRWRLRGTYSFIDLSLRSKPGSLDATSSAAAGRTPSHMASVWSFLTLPHGLKLDLGLRGASRLPVDDVPGYVTADARVAWTVRSAVELSLVGRNLFDARHLEFRESVRSVAVPRSFYVRVVFRF